MKGLHYFGHANETDVIPVGRIREDFRKIIFEQHFEECTGFYQSRRMKQNFRRQRDNQMWQACGKK